MNYIVVEQTEYRPIVYFYEDFGMENPLDRIVRHFKGKIIVIHPTTAKTKSKAVRELQL